MQTKRLFVGIGLSSVLAKRLEREMGVFEPWPIIPTRKQNLHVTLLFLGFLNEEALPEVIAGVEEAAQASTPFELHFDQIGYFPDNEHPTAVRLLGQADELLLQLRQNLDHGLGYLVPDKKSFRPHVTLGKVRRGKFEALPEKPSFDKKVNLVEPVSTVTLYESTTENGKRVFLPLAEFPLGQ